MIAGATLIAALGGAAPASAWWAETGAYRTGSFGYVDVHGVPGEHSDLVVTGDETLTPSHVVWVRDRSAPATPAPDGRGEGCTQVGTHVLRCVAPDYFPGGPEPTFTYLGIDLGDGRDRVEIPFTTPLFVYGSTGPGNDTVVNHSSDGATLELGEGNDRVTLRGSDSGFLPNDQVNGNEGDDVIDVFNGSADDAPGCGDGQDVLYADVGEDNPDCETRYPHPKL
ncbi:MAG: hypothetical protein M3340_07395 [Actinomycetota bacterium]|nr:hypothetical protein [Actinomycetota bacterium]